MKQITFYLPTNHVTDGSVDYTAKIQQAVNENEEVQFPDYPLMVNERGIIPPSNRLLQNPNLVMKATALGSYNLIRLQKVDNIEINNATIKGDRYTHIGTAGEWGNGIGVYGCSNITINALNVSNCWGDGIYIAGKDSQPCRDITINNATCYANRRNGISIISTIGLTLNSPNCIRTSGVLPMCGIDIEPNTNLDEIQDIVINNPRTELNTEYGIAIAISALYGSIEKNISIKIVRHVDYYAKAGLRVSANPKVGSGKVSGVINIIDPHWIYNSFEPWQIDIRERNILLNVVTPNVVHALTKEETIAVLTKKENVNANYKLSF